MGREIRCRKHLERGIKGEYMVLGVIANSTLGVFSNMSAGGSSTERKQTKE
jgi:hypothetical protein